MLQHEKDTASALSLTLTRSCSFVGGQVQLGQDTLQEMNHWVAAVPDEESVVTDELVATEGTSDNTIEFVAKMKSLLRLLIETTTDGDCGLDTMCLMLGQARTPLNRNRVRQELVELVLSHQGNRALISALGQTNELQHNIGEYELEAAGRELFAHHCHGAALAHHCHCAALAVPDEPPLSLAVPAERHFSEEEIAAFVWKCRLQKHGRATVVGLMKQIQAPVIDTIVIAHRSREVPTLPPPKKPCFILTRDKSNAFNNDAVEHLFSWCREHHGQETYRTNAARWSNAPWLFLLVRPKSSFAPASVHRAEALLHNERQICRHAEDLHGCCQGLLRTQSHRRRGFQFIAWIRLRCRGVCRRRSDALAEVSV